MVFGVDRLYSICPWSNIKIATLAEVEQHRSSMVQQRKDPQRTVGGDQIEIGHPASQQRMPHPKIVMNVQPGHSRSERPARLVHRQQLGDDFAQCPAALVRAEQRDLRHRRAQDARTDWMSLGVIRIQQTIG